MRYPAFIAEMAQEKNRSRLWAGIWSGYALVGSFSLLLLLANLLHFIPWRWELWAMAGAKLLTNTAALASLRSRKAVLEFSGLNVAMDVLVMTGAIYWSGGQLSPLGGIYIIEITVIALLTNLGITVLIAGAALVLYGAMALATYLGVLPQCPAPQGLSSAPGLSYVIIDLLWNVCLLGVATIFTSIVLRRLRAKEHALQRKTAEVIEAGRLKSQFMANISHELRTPIQGILGVADLVHNEVYGPVTENQKKAQRSIKRSAQALLDMIEDLLKLSMADAGHLDYKPQPVDIAETIEQAAASTRWMLEQKDQTLSLDLDTDVGEVVTDRGKLNQILIHLITNAVKFTPEGGQVLLTARRGEDRWLSIAIMDTGVGIPNEEHDRIFEDFRQVDGTAERSQGGMGVGLALVKRLLGVMGGEVKLSSTLGEGSTFTVRIPPEPPKKEFHDDE